MKLKLILPTALASIVAACAVVPPKPGTDAYQKMLEDQARENFYALKAREHPSRPAPVVAQAEPPPKVHLKPFNLFATAGTAPAPTPKPVPAATPTPAVKPVVVARSPAPKAVPPSKPIAATKPAPAPKPVPPAKPIAAAKPAPTPKPSKPLAFNPFARSEKPRPGDETVYLYDMPHGPEPSSPRYRAYKIQYAHELAKRPEDLTADEREWVRRHYRD